MARRSLFLLLGIGLLVSANSSPATVGNGPAASPQQISTVPQVGGWWVSTPRAQPSIDLSALCSAGNCDRAFASLRAGSTYHLPAGVWTFSTPFNVPSHVTLTGDGTGIAQGTDLVYTGPEIAGAVITAGAPGTNWVDGHIAAFEIETAQLHESRVRNAGAWTTVDQAGVGLEIINPAANSTVDNVKIGPFGRNSIVIDNHAPSPGSGFFQLSDFFIGGSPRPLEVRGSSAGLLLRFGGVDLGTVSQLGMLFAGDQTGATAVVEAVKIEGDYDVPAVVVTGAAPVILVGSTRYLNQTLYVDRPMNSAPSFLSRDAARPVSDVLQCLGCTALGQSMALAIPDLSLAIPASKWGINLHHLSAAGASAVASALQTPYIPLSRPHKVVNLAQRCAGRNCDDAFAALEWGGRYYLPAGLWTFSRPFTIPSAVTFFGDGSEPGDQGGTELKYVGPSLDGDAAVRFGPGGDMSGGRLFSIRISTLRALSGGFGLRARNATNASTIEGISVSGFPDGQLLVDGSPRVGPGPNFLRIARFSLSGGVHPLQVIGGRQNLLIQQGTINLAPNSQDGLYILGGEKLAMTHVVESVSVTGNRDVPGFRVDSTAVTVFVASSRTTMGARVTSPGFLDATTVEPGRVMECLRCSVSGLRTALAMPALGISIPAQDLSAFDYLNSNTQLRAINTPFNVELPAAVGSPVVGQTLTTARGGWTTSPTGYDYQWFRCPTKLACPGTRCSAITGATRSTYVISSADSGFYLRVTVGATNASGTQTATSLPLLVSG